MRLNKFIWIAGFVAAFAVPTYVRAQAPQPPAEFTFKVTTSELDTLARGLESQPYAQVVPLLQKLREQFAAQQPKPSAPVTPVEPKKE